MNLAKGVDAKAPQYSTGKGFGPALAVYRLGRIARQKADGSSHTDRDKSTNVGNDSRYRDTKMSLLHTTT